MRSLEVKVGSHLNMLAKIEENGLMDLVKETQRLKGSLTLTLIGFLRFFHCLWLLGGGAQAVQITELLVADTGDTDQQLLLCFHATECFRFWGSAPPAFDPARICYYLLLILQGKA